MPKVKPGQVRLRKHNFPTAECEYCRYYQKGWCLVLERGVRAEQVCDAYQGDEKKYTTYKVEAKDLAAFGRGMKKLQPYKHVVVKGIDTPVGFLLLIKDSMKPRAHYFSLDMNFSVEHTSREHAWTQAEVDLLVRAGSK